MTDHITQFYEEWHRSAGANRSNEIRDRDLMALDFLRDCESVFELGCGSGTILDMSPAPIKAGIDISEEAIRVAGKTTSAAKPKDLRTLNIDSADLPWDDETFDGCMAIEVLEHLFDPIHALAEMNRITKKHGKLVVTIPNIGYFHCRLYHLTSGEFSDFHGNGLIVNEHIRFYGVKTIRRLIELSGFKVVNIRGARKKVMQNSSESSSGGISVKRILWALRPTPINVIFRCNILFRLWRWFPSLFAVGLVVEATKTENSMYRYNTAIDHQVRSLDKYALNVNTIR